MAWDAKQYDRFKAQRSRPARDLLAALPEWAPRRIVDLGCGGGALARELARRFPGSEVIGVDSSGTMLAQAGAQPSVVRWIEADIAAWAPDVPIDLIVSNAALHWLSDHAGLFARLPGHLAPGGVLAVQMPRQHVNPSHTLLAEVAADPRWADRLAQAVPRAPRVHEPGRYYDWLAPRASWVDVWETEYLHVLEGEDAVFEWVKGTTLVPVEEALSPDELAAFEAAYRARLAAAYPRRADGATLLPFRRLFVMAGR
ncbi:MAG TPA: methyltransferase domain-containing protein [Azospirillaceae bacterium]|nr:methyltransferase domain-containing protein [Azospirillaceae bacterium]